jgi:rare lipoprotein A
MRPLLALTAVIVFSITTSLGAASRLNNSEGKQSAKSAQTVKVKNRSQHAKSSADHPYQIGRASWYGKYFHGKMTASGEPYNMFQFTAAHPELPLGTYVKVTNLRNHRWVIVRVNDRGPVPESRIIDLSYGAAQMVGLRAHGVERVRLDLVEPPNTAADSQEVARLHAGGGN